MYPIVLIKERTRIYELIYMQERRERKKVLLVLIFFIFSKGELFRKAERIEHIVGNNEANNIITSNKRVLL